LGKLDGKVAIVTGAGQGIGRAGAILFAKEGAKVVVNDYAAEGGKETVQMIKKAGGEATFVQGDVSKEEDVKKMVRTAVDTYGKLDVLYNNAGVLIFKALTDLTEEDFNKVISVNLKGTWLGMKYAIPEMVKAGGGSIVNASSIVADMVNAGSSFYAASKGAIKTLTMVAAVEYAAKKIRVNCLKPGFIMTPMFTGGLEFGFGGIAEGIKHFGGVIPMGRVGTPEEVAQVALFLASDDSSYITGQSIVVDGGHEADNHVG
jgi:NAD(P)-dependent dehydrogenase (short-subunit alcohol dehydrogenase family)